MKAQWLVKLRKGLRDTSAQDMVEYALLAGFVAVTISAAFPQARRPWIRLARKLFKTTAVAAGVGSTWSC